ITYFAESTPSWVIGELEAGFEQYGTEYRGDGGRSPDREPGVNAYIGYENGVRGFLSGMKSGVQQVSIHLIGSEGRIEMNDQQASMFRQTEAGVSMTPIISTGTRQGIQAGILDLLHAMETGDAPQCPPREARRTVALIQGIL